MRRIRMALVAVCVAVLTASPQLVLAGLTSHGIDQSPATLFEPLSAPILGAQPNEPVLQLARRERKKRRSRERYHGRRKERRERHHDRRKERRRGRAGAAIGGLIVGGVIGAAVSNSRRQRFEDNVYEQQPNYGAGDRVIIIER